MKLRSLFICTLLFLFFIETIKAQKVLLLQKPGNSKWYMYKTGDKISIRMGEPEFIVYGELTSINDSNCTIDKNYTFQLSKVKEVTRVRPFLNGSWRKLYLASILYFAGSMLNHAINDEKPLVDNTVPYVSGSLAVLGTTSLLLRYRHFDMEKGWILKVLDFDIYHEKYEPQK